MDQGLRSLPGEIQNQEQREEEAPSLRDHPAAPWAPAQPLGADPALPLLRGTLLCLSMNDPTVPPQEPRTEHFCPEPSKPPFIASRAAAELRVHPELKSNHKPLPSTDKRDLQEKWMNQGRRGLPTLTSLLLKISCFTRSCAFLPCPQSCVSDEMWVQLILITETTIWKRSFGKKKPPQQELREKLSFISSRLSEKPSSRNGAFIPMLRA